MNKVCFVIGPIGEPESETRKRSDQVLKHIIKPAAEKCGYEAIRADQISEPGLITTQVIQHIINDPLVIADLTGRNPNVYYELALRHAVKGPLVQIIAKGEQLPFDVAGMRTISIDHHDLDSVDETRQDIIKYIQALESHSSEIDSPISIATTLQALRQSDKPEQRSLADLVASMAELGAGLARISAMLNDPSSLLPSSYIREVLRSNGPLTTENIAIRDEMAYLVHRLIALSTDSNLEPNSKNTEAIAHLSSMQELLKRWSAH